MKYFFYILIMMVSCAAHAYGGYDSSRFMSDSEYRELYLRYVGYRGMINFTPLFPMQSHTIDTKILSTTHGYEFRSGLFVGAGVGFGIMDYHKKIANYFPESVDKGPLKMHTKIRALAYAAARYYYPMDCYDFIGDVQIGKWLSKGDGLYMCIGPGVRLNLGQNRFGVSVSVVYSVSWLGGTYRGFTADLPYTLFMPSRDVFHHIGLHTSIDF